MKQSAYTINVNTSTINDNNESGFPVQNKTSILSYLMWLQLFFNTCYMLMKNSNINCEIPKSNHLIVLF